MIKATELGTSGGYCKLTMSHSWYMNATAHPIINYLQGKIGSGHFLS